MTTTPPNSGINEIVANNYAKIKAIREKGIDPFPHRFKPTHKAAEAAKCPADTPVTIAGRMVLMRVMGKATFAHIKDGTGKIQIYVKKDVVGEEPYELFKKQMHVGDFLGVEGKLFVTHTGELTVNAEKLTILSKSVRPLPEKFHGLTDAEARYRERYLDLISNEDVRTIFVRRSQIVAAIRDVLNTDGYLEVETPVLCAQAGGASARPFITFHNAYKYEMYMRIATELP
ncbi:MAG TPA: lysine--tRNA ligase, partial [Elusimicrobia bacterium]|nr:lysine--tRNA ligase [Elusimicrobiota bacterium]